MNKAKQVDLSGFTSPIDHVNIDSDETIAKRFGEAHQRGDSSSTDPVYRAFCKKIGQIQAVGYKHGIGPATCLKMINVKFGLWWDTIPWGRMGEMCGFIDRYGPDSVLIIDPELAEKYRAAGGYGIPKGFASKDFVAGFANVLGKMLENRCSEKQFFDYTADVCKALS